MFVGTQQSAVNAALFLAAARGFFKEEGLEVELKAFPSGPDTVAALAAGQLDFAVTELTAAALNLAGKGTIKAIAGQARENKEFEGNDVVASVRAYNRGLKKFEDLAGHTIAITQLGTPFHYQVGQIARVKKFDLDKIILRPLNTLEAISAAIVDNKVDAAILPGIYARDLLMAGQARMVGWYSEIDQSQLGALFTTPRMIAQKRTTIEKFVKAYRRGAAEFTGALMRRDSFTKRKLDARSHAVADLVGRYVYPRLPASRAIDAVEATAFYLDPQAKLDVADVMRQFDWFKSQGMIDPDADPKAVVDPSFGAGLK